MKRMLALTLCLVMVLGLFTGVAGAETVTGELTVKDHWDSTVIEHYQRGPNGTAEFELYYDGTTPIPNTATVTVYETDASFSTGKAVCTLTPKTENNETYWFWNLNALDFSEVTQTWYFLTAVWSDGEATYTYYTNPDTTRIIINEPSVAVYSDSACTDYIPAADRMFLMNGSEKTVYLKPANFSDMTIGDVQISGNNTVTCTKGTEQGSYTITAPANFTGTETVTLVYPLIFDRGDFTETDDYSVSLTFTDGKNLSTRWDNGNPTDDGNVPACGDWGVRMFYGMENDPVPSNAEVYFLDSTDGEGSEATRSNRFGTISYNPNDGRWGWIRDSAIAGATGTMVAKISGVEYTRSVTMTYPELTFFTYVDLSTSTPEYVPYDSLTFLYDGTKPICYIAATMDWIEKVEIDNKNFTLTPVTDSLFTVSANEGLTGTHMVTFVASNDNNSRFECEVTFTDGKNLSFFDMDGQPVGTTRVNVNSQWGGVLTYGLDQKPVPSTATVKIVPDEGWDIDDLATLKYTPGTDDNGRSWEWIFEARTAVPGASGTYSVIVGGTTYSFHATFAQHSVSFYRDANCTDYIPYSDLLFSYSATNRPAPIYAKLLDHYSLNGYITWNNDNFIVEPVTDKICKITMIDSASGPQDVEFQIPLRIGSDWTETAYVSLSYSDGGDGTYEDSRRYSEIKAASTVTEYVPAPPAPDNEFDFDCAVPFELDGVTYYMGISMTTEAYPYQDWSMNPPTNDPDNFFRYVTHAITFWDLISVTTEGTKEFRQITDADTLDKITAAFNGTLSLTMKPYKRDGLAPAKMPAEYSDSTLDSRLVSHTSRLTWDNIGFWRYTATGTVNGQSLSTDMSFCWEPNLANIWSPDLTSETSVVDQINQHIASVEPTRGITDIIQLPAGEFEGHIVLGNKRITMQGATNFDQEPLTTWKGSMQVDADGSLTLSHVHMIGAGSSKNHFTDGKPNYAIYGDGGGYPFHCEFEGYYRAVVSTMFIKTGTNNLFHDNDTAIYVDDTETGAVGGNPGWCDNTYQDNKVAIHFRNLGTDYPVTGWNLTKNRFINNDWDFRNQLKRNFYLPGCFFAGYDSYGNLEPRNIRAKENGSKGPVITYGLRTIATDTEFENAIADDMPVHVYPAYSDPGCTELNYDYTDVPVVSIAYTSQYPIPIENLEGKVITVMDGNTELAQLDFTTKLEESSVFYNAATFSGTRFSKVAYASPASGEDGEPAVFDATVKVVRNADGSISVQLNELPADVTPLVRVKAGQILDADTATNEGNSTAVEMEGEYLCFYANTSSNSSSNEWTIKPTQSYQETTKEDGTSVYTVEAPDGAVHVMLAAYNDSKQMIWASPDEVKDGKVELTGYDLTGVETITFFFLDGNYAPIEGSITRTIS